MYVRYLLLLSICTFALSACACDDWTLVKRDDLGAGEYTLVTCTQDLFPNLSFDSAAYDAARNRALFLMEKHSNTKGCKIVGNMSVSDRQTLIPIKCAR